MRLNFEILRFLTAKFASERTKIGQLIMVPHSKHENSDNVAVDLVDDPVLVVDAAGPSA